MTSLGDKPKATETWADLREALSFNLHYAPSSIDGQALLARLDAVVARERERVLSLLLDEGVINELMRDQLREVMAP